jgi:hypothetical protein
MPYAEGCTYYNADSHLMETQDWMPKYADPDIRELLHPLYLGGRVARLGSRCLRPSRLTR